MTATDQILRELKLLREDFAKFKQAQYTKDKEDEVWVTANILQKKFGTNYRQLDELRRAQVIKFKQVRPGVVRYLLSSAEQYFNNQKQAS
jgi:hypothetical protein